MLVRVLLAALLLTWAGMARAAEVVRVAGYDFPPFVETEGGRPHGLALDMIDALNAAQDKYRFTFQSVAARRRYADLQDGRFDLMLFESPEWEWAEKNLPVDFSNVFLRGGEVYIAQAQPGRGQDYFSSLAGKKMVGILGFHYGFANFNADPDLLARDYGAKLVSSHRSSIEMVLAGRGDVAVVTDSYLWAYLNANPQARAKLLVSDRYDQIYHHRALVRRGGPIDVATVNRLLADMQRDGRLDAIWKKAGVVR
ncbi:MAG: substrate-binding periplasmic protein [Actinomycetota bacterium]